MICKYVIRCVSLTINDFILMFAVFRRDLILRLTQLKERWQSTLHRVQQRSRSLEQLTDKWRLYSTSLKTLWRLLRNLEPLLPPAGLPLCSLHQLQHSIQDYEVYINRE